MWDIKKGDNMYKILRARPFSIVDTAPTEKMAKEIIDEEKTEDMINKRTNYYGIYSSEEGFTKWI